MIPEDKKNKERKTDRILVLKIMEGKKILNGAGMPDPRLFAGGNTLHLSKDLKNNLWKFRYESGIVPEPLKQSFTTFDKALDHCRQYFARRNVEIEKVLD